MRVEELLLGSDLLRSARTVPVSLLHLSIVCLGWETCFVCREPETFTSGSTVNVNINFLFFHRSSLKCYSPRPALSVRSVPRATAISDVVAVDGDELLATLGRLLLLPELVVLPATLVLPQLPVPAFRSERTETGRQKTGITFMVTSSLTLTLESCSNNLCRMY